MTPPPLRPVPPSVYPAPTRVITTPIGSLTAATPTESYRVIPHRTLSRAWGGRVTTTVSGKTDYLVVGSILEDGRAVEEGSKFKRCVGIWEAWSDKWRNDMMEMMMEMMVRVSKRSRHVAFTTAIKISTTVRKRNRSQFTMGRQVRTLDQPRKTQKFRQYQ
mmetsp:Transcript_2516/g.4462  ORF Transcript_2516/g.4462 Transcript_2516/m.4462 type:complete len:161 (+) Transcript_2516:970-1452(+)